MIDGAVDLVDVSRTYSSGRTIGPVTLSVQEGTCFGVVGANGAGKTTLLRCVLGLDGPTAGTARTFGTEVGVGRPDPAVSGLIEEPRFFNWLDATRNLRAVYAGRPEAVSHIDEVLDQVGLGAVERQPVGTYSQGMRQRLGLARVLVGRPRLLVLDEPTNGLDPEGIRWLRGLIADLVDDGRTVLLSSHMLHEVQASADHFVMLEQGRVIASGSVAGIEGVSSLEELYFRALDR